MSVFLQQDFLKVPDVPVTFIIISSLIIFAITISYFIKKYFFSGLSGRKALWNTLRQYAVKKNLNHSHLNILKDFFNSMNNQTAYKIIINRRLFQEKLFDFLAQEKKSQPETASLISEKLFADNALLRQINSVNDLYIGETCAVTIHQEHYLAKIVKIENHSLLLSVPGLNTNAVKLNSAAELYFYREKKQSCSVRSKIEKIKIDALFVTVEKFTSSEEDEHLMADLLLPVHFRPWPLDADEKNKEFTLEGVTRKISDRTLLFIMKTENYKMHLETTKIWEIVLDIPKNFSLTARGKIVPSKKKPGHFVFLYIDVSEKAREGLFEHIKKSNPQRDSIY